MASLEILESKATRRVVFLRLPPHLGLKAHHPRDVTLPLTIAYTATIIKQSGREAHVVDMWGAPYGLREAVNRIRNAKPDVIFVECTSEAVVSALRLAPYLKQLGNPLLVGYGPMPTFMPERILGDDTPFDIGVGGECEYVARDLLDAIDAGTPLEDVRGIAFWSKEREAIVRTEPAPLIEPLDDLPIPDYSLFDMDQYYRYSFPIPHFRTSRWGEMLASRGCPYPCTHCSYDHRQSFGRPFRMHSPERVVDNMEAFVRDGFNVISMEDDCFTFKRDFAIAICDEILRRGIKIKWVMQTRVDLIDKELITRLKSAGCVGISLGIESGNPRILKELKKGFTQEQAYEGIREAQNQGMMLRLLFMIGIPTETADEIRDTIKIALASKAITVQAHICTPYPGTGLLGKEGGDKPAIEDYTSYNRITCNMSACSDEVLWALQKEFYARYYFSLRYLLLFLRQRVLYLPGSWRRDLPLFWHALKYLLWTSKKPQVRDLDQTPVDHLDALTELDPLPAKNARDGAEQHAAGMAARSHASNRPS